MSLEQLAHLSQRTRVGIGGYAAVLNDGTAICTDGVGTKIDLAAALGDFTTIGIDLVAMNVNDLICVGAQPRALVDYIALPQEDEGILHDLLEGLVEGAIQADIDIPSGETAIMPEHLDFVGTAVGRFRHSIGTPNKGDLIIGLPSSGIHANGLQAARSVIGDDPRLLTPTTIYSREIEAILDSCRVTGLAHITGGGWANIHRTGAKTVRITDPLPQGIFDELGQDLDYNYGMGFVVICDPRYADAVLPLLSGAKVVGEVTE